MDVSEVVHQFKDSCAKEILEHFLDKYGSRAALSSSFGVEDQVLTHMLLSIDKNANIFTLDTGRLHPQTYSVMDATNLKYGIKVNVFFPKTGEIENLYKEQGVNGFYESLQNRKKCCFVRKIDSLQRALSELDIWITGLRASQSVTREDLKVIEFDNVNGVIKVNPLLNWSEDDIWSYIKEHNIPYNSLHDEGYPSIGCAPCTRAVEQGADIRSGRWWWENPEHKECGLHLKQTASPNYTI